MVQSIEVGQRETEGLDVEYVIPIGKYSSQSTRVRGFQELFEYGLKAPKPMFILGHKAFEEWQKSGLTDRCR